MKKRSKKILKRVEIIFGVVIGLTLFIGACLLFIFGEDAIGVIGTDNFFESEIEMSNGEPSVDVEDVGAKSFSGDGGSSSGGVGDGSSGLDSEESADISCVNFFPVQYSLTDFGENIECLFYGVGGCERILARCSTLLKNLDGKIGGTFGVRLSLTLGDDIMESKVVENFVEPGERREFETEIILDGNFEMDRLGCAVDMTKVAGKCLD